MNDSSTGGFLAPTAPSPPLAGLDLVNFLQETLAGITGLAGDMVRPRWQAEPPNIPDAGDAWCAFGIQNRHADTFAYIHHDGAAQVVPDPTKFGADRMQRQEELQLLASFYDTGVTGLADYYAELLSDGFQISQNQEALNASGYVFAYSGDIVSVPSLLKARWLYRCDLSVVIRRQIDRTYPVLNIESAQGTIVCDQPDVTVDFVVNE